MRPWRKWFIFVLCFLLGQLLWTFWVMTHSNKIAALSDNLSSRWLSFGETRRQAKPTKLLAQPTATSVILGGPNFFDPAQRPTVVPQPFFFPFSTEDRAPQEGEQRATLQCAHLHRGDWQIYRLRVHRHMQDRQLRFDADGTIRPTTYKHLGSQRRALQLVEQKAQGFAQSLQLQRGDLLTHVHGQELGMKSLHQQLAELSTRPLWTLGGRRRGTAFSITCARLPRELLKATQANAPQLTLLHHLRFREALTGRASLSGTKYKEENAKVLRQLLGLHPQAHIEVDRTLLHHALSTRPILLPMKVTRNNESKLHLLLIR